MITPMLKQDAEDQSNVKAFALGRLRLKDDVVDFRFCWRLLSGSSGTNIALEI